MARTYNHDQFQALMAQAKEPSIESLNLAADYLKALFQANNLGYGFLGGYSLILRGNPRTTQDIDVVVNTTMQQLKQVCSAQTRLILPLGPVAGVMRIFVATGGQWDSSGRPEKLVETDLMLPGNYGIPPNLQGVVEVITAVNPLGSAQFSVLTLQHILSTKLGAFQARGGETDFEDIRWLCFNFYERIAGFRSQLNIGHRQTFIRECERQIPRRGPNFAKRMKSVLAIP